MKSYPINKICIKEGIIITNMKLWMYKLFILNMRINNYRIMSKHLWVNTKSLMKWWDIHKLTFKQDFLFIEHNRLHTEIFLQT
jgi:hypothetical protein